MIRLLRSTLKKNTPNRLYQEDKLKSILSVSMTLLRESTNHDPAFQMLKSLVEMDIGHMMKPHIPETLTNLLSVLDDWMQTQIETEASKYYRKECVVFTSFVMLRYELD